MKSAALPWGLLALCSTILADTLPYNPTRILRTPNSSFAYLFQPSSQGVNQGVLRTVDFSKEFTTNNLPLKTIANSLPFLRDDRLVPYTPVIDGSGNITVIAGSCTAGADETVLWRFSPDPGSGIGNGTWKQYNISDRDLPAGSNLTGTNYLASGVAFSGSVSDNAADMGYYLFGGMCPFSTSTTAANWVGSSAYSNTMLQFAAASAGSLTYGIDSIATRGPPVAEAGFTMTGLTPTFSMNASGGAQSQQQDFLLLGGHTQQAFINMSNVALFSLPQESWTFVPVDQPSAVKTDLATRQSTTQVEPRSGHTSVLSEDGTSLIILGGWVGDITNPAQPQIAVLHLGSEYGGDAAPAWTWSIPTSTGDAVPPGKGIYGHGATMLPGGIMMIMGGYSIAASSSRFVRRAQTSVNGVFLYNTTSHEWLDSYSPASPAASADTQSTGPLSKTSQQAGLGVGLGVGVAALVGVTCFYFWYTKRLRHQREEREHELLAHSSDVSFVQLEQPYMGHGGVDGRGGDLYAGHPDYSPSMQQTPSSSLFLNIPNPNRGQRKGLANRPYMYHQAPRYDDRRLNQGSGNIHPILESADEDRPVRGDDDQVKESAAVQQLRDIERLLGPDGASDERSLRELQRQLKASSLPQRDSFADPEPHANPLGSNPVSPIAETVRRVPTEASRAYSPTRRSGMVEPDSSTNWMVVDDDDGRDPSSSSNGRVSPGRTDDRTSSTLSEQSHRSHASSTSITRTMSTWTGALLSAALAARNARETAERVPRSPAEERTSTMGTGSSGRKSPYYFDRISPTEARTPGAGRHHHDKSQDSFTTAKSNFAQLQDEGQALLGGRPMVDRDDPYQRAMAATSPHMARKESVREYDPRTGLPRRKQGWIGSLRRALTAVSSSERSFSFTSNAGAEQRYEDEPRTSSSSPTRTRKGPLVPSTSTDSASGPRRAVSDGSTLLRHKRGQHDWEKDKDFSPYRDDPDPGDWGEPARTSVEENAADNEWDVEGAASKRDVQVMFTVPKARLRVVNADVERASMRSASDGAVSRTGSVKASSLRRDESVRSRSDGEGERREQVLVRVEEEGVSSGREI